MQKERLTLAKILLKIPVPWVFVLGYLLGLPFQLLFPFKLFTDDALLYVKIAGIILFLVGMILASWSLLIFHKASTTTTPGESSKKLVRKGPYRFSRNPMYVSLILAYLGEAGFLTQVWPVIVLPLVIIYVNRIVIPLEEKILRRDFEGEYEMYCKQVRRWL
jgi:protein-S-isoprenylcysteine O-methyltransferase Ste14